MGVSTFNFSLLDKKQLTKDTFSFYFDTSSYDKFSFLPGQYVRVILPKVKNDNVGSSRNFTIASPPSLKGEIMITTKITQSPFKQNLLHLLKGEAVEFFGPVGRFVLDAAHRTPHVFLSGGIGITPFYSMLMYANDNNLEIPITLLASFSDVENVIFYDELMRGSKSNPYIKTIFTISRPQIDVPYRFKKGRISKDMILKYCNDVSDATFFVSGPLAQVDAMVEMLSELGVDQRRIRKEVITGY